MAQIVKSPSPAGFGYRIRDGNVLAFVAMPYQTGLIADGSVRVVYDDGREDDFYFDPSRTTTAGTSFLGLSKQAKSDGWVVGGNVYLRALTGTTGFSVRGYGQLLIVQDANANRVVASLGQGFTGAFQVISVGQFQADDFAATWVFQGTAAEDATAGTHVSSLTVTPGAGNEMQLMYYSFVAGAGAANITTITIDDATNNLTWLVNGLSLASGAHIQGPFTGAQATDLVLNVASPIIISGTMRFKMAVSTATVSLTHTFAVICRIKGAPPTATLADSVGVPTLTTNTNAVFG